MKVRMIDMDKDYSDLSSWWKQQDWPVVDKDLLSTTGFIVEEDNKKFLAGWVYHTNSNMALIEFCVGNPEFKGEIRDRAFASFFDVVFKYAELSGFRNLFATASSPKIQERLDNVGFIRSNSNAVNFMRSV